MTLIDAKVINKLLIQNGFKQIKFNYFYKDVRIFYWNFNYGVFILCFEDLELINNKICNFSQHIFKTADKNLAIIKINKTKEKLIKLNKKIKQNIIDTRINKLNGDFL